MFLSPFGGRDGRPVLGHHGRYGQIRRLIVDVRLFRRLGLGLGEGLAVYRPAVQIGLARGYLSDSGIGFLLGRLSRPPGSLDDGFSRLLSFGGRDGRLVL